MAPAFLTLDEVVQLHQRLIDEFGGSPGVRDMGLLQSALATPGAAFGGEFMHDSISAMAAAYLFHLVKNHPFVDGNKRTAATAARVFVLLNEMKFDPPEDQYQSLVLAAAAGELDKAALTRFFAEHVTE